MLVMCDNKGCLKSSNALLDQESKDVLCGECGKVISNVSEAMKRTLKSFGQVVRLEQKTLLLACRSCRANREVVFDQDNKTICKVCHEPITVHAAFKMAMEEAGNIEKIDTKKTKKKRKKSKK